MFDCLNDLDTNVKDGYECHDRLDTNVVIGWIRMLLLCYRLWLMFI